MDKKFNWKSFPVTNDLRNAQVPAKCLVDLATDCFPVIFYQEQDKYKPILSVETNWNSSKGLIV